MQIESEWLKVALNALSVIAIGVVGYLNNRVSRLEEWVKTGFQKSHDGAATASRDIETRLREVETGARRHSEEGDDKLWDAITRHEQETREFRERILREGATKADVAALKVDLKEHIDNALAGAVARIKNG